MFYFKKKNESNKSYPKDKKPFQNVDLHYIGLNQQFKN